MDELKIAAFDDDDLKVISAHLQDAIIRICDIDFNTKTRQFVLVANRFSWELEAGDKNKTQRQTPDGPTGLRKRTGLMFAGVLSAKSQLIKQGAPEAVLNLLAVEFVAGTEPPSGEIKLLFSGGGVIELEVECVEVIMEDLGAGWETENIPSHDELDREALGNNVASDNQE